jgi:serine/threonine protein kinase/Flp pilus assembly protein TadD
MTPQAPADSALEPTSEVIRILEEYLDELQAGARPDPERLAARFPELAGPLKSCLVSLEFLQDAALSFRGGGQPVLPAADAPSEIGRLGDFHVLREVGRGGMGVVYEAEQISLGRRVALKVLPFAAAFDARQLQRFKNEAQAAAQLHHTNIVPVYAVGCERGVHYYAMQFIDGRTLAEVIAGWRAEAPGAAPPPDTFPVAGLSTESPPRRPESFRAIARLGLQAAEALEHAHQLGVVHRDVKPANLILDAHGNVWVTDFGLARLHRATGLTVSGDLLGTLRYMSPEQALGDSAAVGPRTDVYALGATLYEMLTLHPVFDGRDRQELLRRIASEEPRPPRRLNPAVPAELEVIVGKALEKDPATRYATAQELADDLRRFREDKPIRARRPSWLEQARKWARRHRPAVWSAVAALLVTLAVLAAGAGWVVRDRAARQAKLTADLEAAWEDAQRSRREGRWPQAQAAAQRAEALLQDGADGPALTGRVQGLLRELAAEEADGRLEAGLEKIRLGQAEVDRKGNRFALEEALPEYRRAFAAYGLRAETTTPEEAAARLRRRPQAVRGAALAALDHWLILARYKRAPESDWLDRVLSAAEPDPWRQAVRVARARNDRKALEKLACEVDVAAQPPEALFMLERGLRQRGAAAAAVEMLRRAQGVYPGDFWINHDLAVALLDCRPPQVDAAIRYLTAAVALRPNSTKVRLHLGSALWRGGQRDEAIAAFRKAVELNPDLAEAHGKLGTALAAGGRLDEATAAFRKAVALNPGYAEAYSDLGTALWRAGRRDEAVASFRRAVTLQPSLAVAHAHLGAALAAEGRLDEATAPIHRAIALRPDCSEAHHALGNVLARKGRFKEAASAQRRAIELKPDYAEAHCDLGRALCRQGELAEALTALQRGHKLGCRRPDWPYPSAKWVEECRRLIESNGRSQAPPPR